MFQEISNATGTAALDAAEGDEELTMIVGRDPAIREILVNVSQRDDRAAFLIAGNVLSAERAERWFGDASATVLALLNYDDVPDRTARKRWEADVLEFDVADEILAGEAEQGGHP